MRFFIGMLGTVVGFMMVWKSNAMMEFSGRIAWAEKYLGLEGGTRVFWKLVGIVIIFVSWMYMLNLGEGILRFFLLPNNQQ